MNLREWRESLGLSLAAAARWLTDRGLKTTDSQLSKWERGACLPRRAKREKLQALTGVTPGALLDGAAPPLRTRNQEAAA